MKYRCVVLFGALAAVVAVASVPMAGQAQRDLRSPAVPMAESPAYSMGGSRPAGQLGDPGQGEL